MFSQQTSSRHRKHNHVLLNVCIFHCRFAVTMLLSRCSTSFFHLPISCRSLFRATLNIRRLDISLITQSVTGSSLSRFSTMSPDKSIKYDWIDGVERLDMYEPGGYHPVMIGNLLHGRYRIVDKLGYGGYSTIWLARDDRLKRYVAIKVGISRPPLPQREPSVLRDLCNSRSSSHATYATIEASDAIPRIVDEFDIQGPNGVHTCYTMTPAQGNLNEASFSRLFPIQVARALAAKLVMTVAFVHSRGFVHGGLFMFFFCALVSRN